jgi:hypothetical protein
LFIAHIELNTVELCYNVSKGPNKLCSYKRVSLYERCEVYVKENYFITKYQPADTLLNANVMIHFKFTFQ